MWFHQEVRSQPLGKDVTLQMDLLQGSCTKVVPQLVEVMEEMEDMEALKVLILLKDRNVPLNSQDLTTLQIMLLHMMALEALLIAKVTNMVEMVAELFGFHLLNIWSLETHLFQQMV